MRAGLHCKSWMRDNMVVQCLLTSGIPLYLDTFSAAYHCQLASSATTSHPLHCASLAHAHLGSLPGRCPRSSACLPPLLLPPPPLARCCSGTSSTHALQRTPRSPAPAAQVVSSARAVVLASGTLSPIEPVLQLFPFTPREAFHHYSCGHVVGRDRWGIMHTCACMSVVTDS